MIPDGIVRSLEEENWKLEYKSKKLKITNILWTRTIEYQEIDKYDISIVKKFSNRGSDYWQMKVQITTKQNEDIRLYADFHESLFHFIKINQDRIIKLTKLKDELLNEYHNVASLNKI